MTVDSEVLPMAVLPARVLFGAAYYHEYQLRDRLPI